MTRPEPVRTLDGELLATCLAAGIRHLFSRREYIDRINVFPVPDGDTGTNMAFTFKAILEQLPAGPKPTVEEVMVRVSEASLDGARGNSGAIMAQFFQGFREAVTGLTALDAESLARACRNGAGQSWTAMSEPVAGTLPTVLEAFADTLSDAVEGREYALQPQFAAGLAQARIALAQTPDLLPVLKQAGVVDAGAQGFVDLLEGIQAYIDTGRMDPLPEQFAGSGGPHGFEALQGGDVGKHRFCTECVIEGAGLDREAVMQSLQGLEHSSLVVAGSETRVRVHIHVNQPGEVFLACEAFGEITQQKADDMQWQQGLMNLAGSVAVVTDSGADLPTAEVERLGLQIVPVRLSFGEQEFLDGVTLKPADFYRMLDEAEEFPKTSQPPPQDFRRVFELLRAHDYKVLTVGLSEHLSGTIQAARTAASRMEPGAVEVFDTLNASCGQGLLALVAAEAAAEGWRRRDIVRLLEELVPQTRTLAMADELDAAVRGGRVPAWVARLAGALRLSPILAAREGRMGIAGAAFGRGTRARSLARKALRQMKHLGVCRVLIAHADNPEGAQQLRRLVLAGHPEIHSCHIAEAGPALGAHLGRGGLVAGFLPQPHVLK